MFKSQVPLHAIRASCRFPKLLCHATQKSKTICIAYCMLTAPHTPCTPLSLQFLNHIHKITVEISTDFDRFWKERKRERKTEIKTLPKLHRNLTKIACSKRNDINGSDHDHKLQAIHNFTAQLDQRMIIVEMIKCVIFHHFVVTAAIVSLSL